MSKAVRDSISHIKCTVKVLDEDPTKITITNASIDKQKTWKCDYITILKHFNTDLEIVVSGFLLGIL